VKSAKVSGILPIRNIRSLYNVSPLIEELKSLVNKVEDLEARSRALRGYL
jgi:hypothetical protein